MCFKSVSYCSTHKDTQLTVVPCKGCKGDGCSHCNNKGIIKYCPTCREENTSKFKLLGWRR